jgi:fibronectin-binding autotransporter adhesin
MAAARSTSTSSASFETLSQRGTGCDHDPRHHRSCDALNMAGSNVTVAAGTRFDTQGATALIGSGRGGDRSSSRARSAAAWRWAAATDTVERSMQGGGVEGNIDLGAGNDRLVLAGGTATGLHRRRRRHRTPMAFEISQRHQRPAGACTNFESLDVVGRPARLIDRR